MRCKPLLPFVACTFLFAHGAVAQTADELLKSRGCRNCHERDTRKIGPSFTEIASKYSADPQASERMIEALRAGRRHPKVAASDAELQAMIKQVLATK